MSTGILGGTFDPIHIAHLHAAETALADFELDRMVFMPAGAPWQKSDTLISPPEDRLEMIRLAIEGIDGFEVDDREIRRDGPTYTIDTLESFDDEEDIVLVLGADAALGLRSWHRWEDVIERARLAVVPRAGTDSVEVRAVVPEASFVDMAVLEVSGTDIRAMAAAGRPYRFLVPEAVYRYIEENALYTDRVGGDRVEAGMDQENPS